MFKIITIPYNRNTKGFDDELLQKFSMNKSIKTFRAEFFEDSGEKFWTVFIEYDPLLKETPEKTVESLDDNQKALFEKFRVWRKERAEKEGIPIYIIMTNNEIVKIIKAKPETLENLGLIKGFGKGKIAKYGKEIISLIKTFYEKS
jgi:superfamily II DNA helicase RecQ